MKIVDHIPRIEMHSTLNKVNISIRANVSVISIMVSEKLSSANRYILERIFRNVHG